MWVIQLNITDLVCSKTQILLEDQNQFLKESLVFSEVEYLFTKIGCARSKHHCLSVLKTQICDHWMVVCEWTIFLLFLDLWDCGDRSTPIFLSGDLLVCHPGVPVSTSFWSIGEIFLVNKFLCEFFRCASALFCVQLQGDGLNFPVLASCPLSQTWSLPTRPAEAPRRPARENIVNTI